MYFYYHRVIPVVKYSYGVVLGWYDVCFVWNETKSVVFRVLARKFLKVRKKKQKQKKRKTQNRRFVSATNWFSQPSFLLIFLLLCQ